MLSAVETANHLDNVLDRIFEDKDKLVYHEDVADTLTFLGFHSTEMRHRMYAKIAETIEAIVEARNILVELKNDPKRAFFRFIREGHYRGQETADHFNEVYSRSAENNFKYLVGLRQLAA